MKKNHRWNRFWIGLSAGIILPVICFLGFYLIKYAEVPFGEFLEYSFRMQVLPKILSLCILPNLVIFYIFLNKEYWYSTRGMITATFISAVGVLVIKILG